MAIYLLKLNLSVMLLYGFYKAMMTRDTFFGYRRMALLSILMLSTLVPLMNISSLFEQNATAVDMATVYADYVLPVVPVYASGKAFTWMDAVTLVYFIGVVGLGLRFVFRLAGIVRMAQAAPVVEVEGVEVRRLDGGHSPFSFMRWIFVCPEAQSPEQLHEILVHEQAHVAQRHSWDVVAAELFCVFNWFNPFSYLMKREIRLNLEYLADEAVLDEGNARKTYQYHLLGLAYHPSRRDLTNNFNVLPLKNRIKMMNKSRTKEIAKAKYLLFLPLVAGLLAVSNVEMIARTIDREQPAVEKAVANKAAVVAQPVQSAESGVLTSAGGERTVAVAPAPIEQNKKVAKKPVKKEKVFDVVEQMPKFPGGMSKLMEYLSVNVNYPATAQKAGIQGRVVVSFVVEKDGTISNANVVRSVDPALDAEALRVVMAMPQWTPGTQDGELVRVKYNVPISFKLN